MNYLFALGLSLVFDLLYYLFMAFVVWFLWLPAMTPFGIREIGFGQALALLLGVRFLIGVISPPTRVGSNPQPKHSENS